MIPKLTPEMRIALQEQAGHPVKIEDEQSQKVYLLVEEDDVLIYRVLHGARNFDEIF